MDLRVTVSVDGIYWDGGAAVTVPELLQECFVPMDVCDDGFIAGVVGGVTEAVAERKMEVRRDAAEILSDRLTQLILREMSKRDTRNGYKENNPITKKVTV